MRIFKHSRNAIAFPIFSLLGGFGLTECFVTNFQGFSPSMGVLHSGISHSKSLSRLRSEMGTDSASASDSTLENKPLSIYEVCLSPGCVADGAETTLAQMEALSQVANIQVQPGKCCSLCGNGPILVLESNSEEGTLGRKPPPRKTIRKVTEDKLLELLFEGRRDFTEEGKSILQGFRLYLLAEEALKKKNFSSALELYQEALEFGCATSSKQPSPPTAAEGKDEIVPPSQKWILKCQEGAAIAALELADLQFAILMALNARELSRDQSTSALQTLQKVYEKTQEASKELEVLETFTNLPQPARMTTAEETTRRTLGFRLVKLQKQQACLRKNG